MTEPLIAVYARISLDSTGEQLGVERQLSACRAKCAERGWTNLRVYADNSISASNKRKRRPAYEQMLEDIRAGKVQGVVAWDIDRLWRRPDELEEFIKLAESHQLLLATTAGMIDLNDPHGLLHARILVSVARVEVDQKSKRQKAAHVQRVDHGRPWVPRRPFGYQSLRGDDGHVTLVPHPEEAPLLQAAYARILAGGSRGSVVREWNAAGIRTTVGNAWREPSLHKLLLSPRNAGLMGRLGEEGGRGCWEPLVDEDTWRAVRGIITANATGPGTRSRGTAGLLSGLVTCGACGAAMYFRRPEPGVTRYSCRVRGCGKAGRKVEHLDDLVVELVKSRLAQPDARDFLVDDQRPDAEPLRQRRAALRQRLDRLEDTWITDLDITEARYRSNKAKLKAAIADLDSKLDRVDRAPVLGPLIDGSEPWADLGMDRQRAVVRMLLPEIVVLPGSRRGRPKKAQTLDPSEILVRFLNEAEARPVAA